MRQKFLTALLVSLSLFFSLTAPSVSAQTQSWERLNTRCTHGYAGYTDVATIQGVECILINVLATAVTIIGITAFVMFLVGSFRYLTAGSNTKGVEGGKNAITFAILGIIVALASFLILRFIANFTGVQTILQFNTQLPGSP